MSTPEILLSSGNYFNLLAPDESEFTILDIAHALSNLCRFNGHTREFYSVAQHSVLVSQILPVDDQLPGLLHDAAEALVGDMVRPFKNILPDYRAIEKSVEAAVLKRFGISSIPASVTHADLILLATERRDLLPQDDRQWGLLDGITPLDARIEPWTPIRAEFEFLNRYSFLTGIPPTFADLPPAFAREVRQGMATFRAEFEAYKATLRNEAANQAKPLEDTNHLTDY